jgi:hypothetical protein
MTRLSDAAQPCFCVWKLPGCMGAALARSLQQFPHASLPLYQLITDRRRTLMIDLFQRLYEASWLWLPVLVLFLVQGLHCSPSIRLALFKIALYYIVAAIGLQLLMPTAHLSLRVLLFDLTSRVFLFIHAAEILWSAWSTRAVVVNALKQQQPLDDGEEQNEPAAPRRQRLSRQQQLLIWYALIALLYLGWAALGVAFAFTLTPGM